MKQTASGKPFSAKSLVTDTLIGAAGGLLGPAGKVLAKPLAAVSNKITTAISNVFKPKTPAIQPKPAQVQPRTNTVAANNTAAGARPSGGSGNTGRPASSPSCNSFVPGTLVLLADETSRAIEDLRVGDLVLATDPESGVTRAEPVVATITGVGDKHLVTITVTDEHGNTGSVVATDGHPFWVADTEMWTDAAQLVPGDWLRTSSGTWVQVSAIEHAHREQTVHNLTVNAAHTYYVYAGDAPVLNHNCGPDIANARHAQTSFSETFSKGGLFGGRSIDDVASSLRSGALTPKDVPIDVITREGTTLILNTRSSQALIRAGIPRPSWNVVDRTGQAAFEARLTAQLSRNGLTSRGVDLG